MKKFFKSKMVVSILAGWFLLSGVGYLGKDNIYQNYSVNTAKSPYFVLVFQGFRDHIYPWDIKWRELFEYYPKQTPNHVLAKELEDTQEPEEMEGNVQASDEKEPGTGAETGQPGTVADIGQPGTVADIGQPGTVADIGQPGTEAGNSGTETGQPGVEETQTVRRKFVTVEEDYFEDAVFIGDSRTVGLQDYGGLDKTDFFATVGMNVYDLWTDKFCEVNGEKVTLEEALTAKQYGKIYFQIGINEMGRGTLDGFMEKYAQSVEKIRELQPEAFIFLQGIMKVTAKKSNSDSIFNNQGIQARNERIAELADGITVFYIDVNEVVCDETGGLRADLTFDNLHLYGSKYGIWVDFLKTRGIKDVES